MIRANTLSALAGIVAIVIAGLTIEAVPALAASDGQASGGAPRGLLHQFPLGNRRLCCRPGIQTVASGSATSSSSPSSIAGQGSSGGSGGGSSGGSNRLLTAAIVVIAVIVLMALVALVAIARGAVMLPSGVRRHRRTATPHEQRPPGAPPQRAAPPEQPAPPERAAPPERPVKARPPARSTKASTKARPAKGPQERPPPAELPAANGTGGLGAGERAEVANNAAQIFERALALHEHGEIDAAASAYRLAEEQGVPDAAFNLGVMLYEVGDTDGAEDAWRRCLEHQHAKAATNLGFLLQQRGDLEGARSAYHEAEHWGDPVGRRLGAALQGAR